MRALVAGWFSFDDGHATAGDLMTRDLICEWLEIAGIPSDVAHVPPFSGGVDWRSVDPQMFTHVVFVCGPFGRYESEEEFLTRFSHCRLLGMNLSMKVPLNEWNPFDFLIERDSSAASHPDMSFLSRQGHVPVVGVCLVEPYEFVPVEEANIAIQRLIASNHVATVQIDTRLDTNGTGLRTPAEIESLLARMDVVITTRLHGTVLSLKNGVPVLAIDPEVGGWKIRHQAEVIGWPVVFSVDTVTEELLQKALDYCLTEEARTRARECRDRAMMMVEDIKREFITALTTGDQLEQRFQSRLALLQAEEESIKKNIDAQLLASVVIPCYNHARFLGEAIESVLAQTYPPVEIIVVDDGSTDHAAEVVALYPSVQYMRQDNAGLAAARNTGLRASHGDVLVFLDADDRLLPEALEHGVQHLLNSPGIAFASGRYRYITEDGSILSEEQPHLAEPDHYASFLSGNNIGMHGTVVYRRSMLETEGGFNPSLAACEEYDLCLRIARKYPVSAHEHVVAEYRQHVQNMSRDPILMLKSALAVLNANWEHARTKEIYREAYRTGKTFWREFYSRDFYEQVYGQRSAGYTRRTLDLVMHWFRYAPWQFAGYTFWHVARFTARRGHRILPQSVRRLLLKGQDDFYIPPKGNVRFGDLRRLTPISREFGIERGLPVDRYYVDSFLARHADDIHGHVLEVGDNGYMCRFGGERVLKKDILHVTGGKAAATTVTDLRRADRIPSNLFDCIILTQTLHLIYDVDATLQTLRRILKPGGVLLATFPGISHVSIDDWSNHWYWSFTLHSAHRMFEEVFSAKNLEIQSYGNVLAATALLQGVSVEELDREELDYSDYQYQTVIAVRAVKPERTSR